MIYDTLKLVDSLEQDFTPAQARKIVGAITSNDTSDVATKTDLGIFKSEIKSDFVAFRSEVKQDLTNFKSEVKQDLAGFKVEMVRWIVGAIAFNLLTTVGLMLAIVKYLGH